MSSRNRWTPAGVFSARNWRSSESVNPKSRRLDIDLAITDLGAAEGDLQPNRVARFETGCRNAFACLPTRRPFVVRGQIRRRIQTQTRDDRISVPVARVNRDPLAAPPLTVIAKFGGADRRFQ